MSKKIPENFAVSLFLHTFAEKRMEHQDIYSAAQLSAFIQQVGFLPLLDSGIRGFSAEDVVTDDCRYVVFPDGGWDWPMWKWKGQNIVTEDFVYPTDKHGKEYGWGWSLLNTPELLLGKDACYCERTPEASYVRMAKHLRTILPEANDAQIAKLLK